MSEVQVLQKTKIVPNGRNRGSTRALKVDRIRVAAYCRVSTDDDEQLGSFESQKLYYEQKIASNKEKWITLILAAAFGYSMNKLFSLIVKLN